MIEVSGLNKIFKTVQKEPGIKGSLKTLISPRYIERHALADINLTVNKGEIVGLIGANGAGKTTLSKILSGIIYPTSGNVKVLGHTPWDRSNDYRRKMSLIMGQKASLWWDLPAYDCYLLLKEIYQIDQHDFNLRLNHLAEILDVTKHLKTQIRKLSLGERMKVELIATLLHHPEVIFLDEPTIGLDLTAQKSIRDFIKQYQKEHSPCMILTSHYMEDIEHLCERIIILKEGRIIYDGSLQNVVNQFANEKQITITLDNGQTISEKCPRNLVSDRLQHLLNQYQPIDLNVNEMDIADVIEKMMRTGEYQ